MIYLAVTLLQYLIRIKELIIEWEDYQNEQCAYIECLQVMHSDNIFKKLPWISQVDNQPDIKHGQLIRFVKPPGRKVTFIRNEDEMLFWLDFPRSTGDFVQNIDREYETEREGCTLTKSVCERKHELLCSIKPMFDANKILPIKNAHLTVLIARQEIH